MRGKAITQAQWTIYAKHRAMGLNQVESSRMAAISVSAARAWEAKHPDRGGYARAAKTAREMPDPIRPKDLCKEAQRALEDFDYFQLRYLGRIGIPWQKDAAEKVASLLETRDKEYVVINAPPGAGKSSLFTYAIPLWLTARNRAIRGLIGSATSRLASQYTISIRRALETVIPIRADSEDMELGLACDAEATMSEDFGRFKPVDHLEAWTKDAFVVEQFSGVSLVNKEPTWTAAGRDQEIIGGRYDFCMWDDLITDRAAHSQDAIEKDRRWWNSVAERRLEPGGLLILQGQRLGASDLYRYCLDMEVLDIKDRGKTDTDGASARVSEGGARKKYHHILYKAHYEDRCKGADSHEIDASPYPDGCLLSPRRVTWVEISSLQLLEPSMFYQVYQQEDAAPGSTLVDIAWVNGTGGHPGCWDKDRDRLEIPRGLTPPYYSIASVDPSPTRYWGIEWWLYHPESELRFLIDLEKRAMSADELLDWNPQTSEYFGLMEEWQRTSIALSCPITHWVIEKNGANAFLLQQSLVKRWQAKHGVEIIPHETHKNKTDPQYGVSMLSSKYRFGNVRLPGKLNSIGRMWAYKLVEEATKWPQGATDDLVMSQWFFEFNLQYGTIGVTEAPDNPQKRPSWLVQRRPRALVAA